MLSTNRDLIALDILAQDMAEELALPQVINNQCVSEVYIRLMEQYFKKSTSLEKQTTDLSEYEFSNMISSSRLCLHLTTKKMLLVQNRLLGFVVDFYTAKTKLDKIRHVDFSEQADIHFELLNTKTIKLRSQFRTAALAMKKSDYAVFMQAVCLADFDWGWQTLMVNLSKGPINW